MMARGPVVYLLLSLGHSATAKDSACVEGFNNCQAEFFKSGGLGGGSTLHCQRFQFYDECYAKNLALCRQGAAGGGGSSSSAHGGNAGLVEEEETFREVYAKNIKQLPQGCHVSLAPEASSDSLHSGSSDSSEIVLPTSVSSYASLPESMRTRPIGSSILYMTWWQWIIFACCCCCCCSSGGLAAHFGGRRRNKNQKQYAYGGYVDEDQYAEATPMYQDPQQVYPLMPAQASYVMPAQASYTMAAPAYAPSYAPSYAQVAAPSYTQVAAPATSYTMAAPSYGYAANMPTAYNLPRMY